jgi:catechol 2,3-dioxygenase-like lactoylglutathione lyase family enzyme
LLQRVYGNASRAAVMRRLLGGVLLPGIVAIAAVLSLHAAPVDDHTARPKITGIDHVRLYVSDVTKSYAFYGNAFGLHGLAGTCSFNAQKCLAVNSHQLVELERVSSPAPQNWVAEIGFATNDVVALRGYLQAHGVNPGKISAEGAGVAHFEVRDPEGNRIAFVQRPEIGTEYPASAKEIGNKLLHAGFVVKDMAAENKFYRDVLGFRVYWYGGFKDNDIDWYEIQVPDGGDWIEYMLNIPANADHKELGVQNHFSLGVKDANAAAAQLRKQGLKAFDGPEVGRDGKNSLDAYDPDGTRVEVMEFTPRRTPCCHAYEAAHPSP